MTLRGFPARVAAAMAIEPQEWNAVQRQITTTGGKKCRLSGETYRKISSENRDLSGFRHRTQSQHLITTKNHYRYSSFWGQGFTSNSNRKAGDPSWHARPGRDSDWPNSTLILELEIESIHLSLGAGP
jgi:hypothetical protein